MIIFLLYLYLSFLYSYLQNMLSHFIYSIMYYFLLTFSYISQTFIYQYLMPLPFLKLFCYAFSYNLALKIHQEHIEFAFNLMVTKILKEIMDIYLSKKENHSYNNFLFL